MFRLIVDNSESASQLALFAVTVLVIETFSALEWLLLKMPGTLLFRHCVAPLAPSHPLRRAVCATLLPLFGRVIAAPPPTANRDGVADCVFASRVWNWAALLRWVVQTAASACDYVRCALSPSYSAGSRQPQSPSVAAHCYHAEAILYATAARFERPVACARWRQVAPTVAPQDTANPSALNNPLTGSLWRRLVMDRLVHRGRNHIGDEAECLQLNVWMPSGFDGGGDAQGVAASRAPHPPRLRSVYVYVAGGAFIFGSAHQSIHDAREWVSEVRPPPHHRGDGGGDGDGDGGCVVVTFNYRVGILGFLQGVGGVEPNLGLWDILAALRWVRANVRHFGGDPARVCVVSQSAGAMAMSALLASPHAAGLFESCVLMSGACLHTHCRWERDACGHIMRHAAALVMPAGVVRGCPAKAGDLVAGHDARDGQSASGVAAAKAGAPKTARMLSDMARTTATPTTTSTAALPASGAALDDDEDRDLREALRAATLQQLIAIQGRYCAHIDQQYRTCCLETRCIPFNVCVGGELVPEHPQVALRGRSRDGGGGGGGAAGLACRRVLFTSTGSEYTLFTMKHQRAEVMSDRGRQVAWAARRVHQFASTVIRDEGRAEAVAARVVERYAAQWDAGAFTERFCIAGAGGGGGGAPPFAGQLWSVLNGDWVFRIPAESLAEDLAALGVDTRLLRVETPCDLVPTLSSPHNGEVPYLFGALHAFPHVAAARWACPRRQWLASEFRRALAVFHDAGSTPPLQRLWPDARGLGGSGDACGGGECAHVDDDHDGGARSFWGRRARAWSVLRVPSPRAWRRDGATGGGASLPPSEPLPLALSADTTAADREAVNCAWDPVMAALLEFRSE